MIDNINILTVLDRLLVDGDISGQIEATCSNGSSLLEQYNSIEWISLDIPEKPDFSLFQNKYTAICKPILQDSKWELTKEIRKKVFVEPITYNSVAYDATKYAQCYLDRASNFDIEYEWIDADNNIQNLSKADIAEICRLIVVRTNTIMVNSKNLRDTIYDVETTLEYLEDIDETSIETQLKIGI